METELSPAMGRVVIRRKHGENYVAFIYLLQADACQNNVSARNQVGSVPIFSLLDSPIL